MPTETHGSDKLANKVFDEIIGDEFPEIPEVDLSDITIPEDTLNEVVKGITPLKNEALTTGVVGGDGTFDTVMNSIKAHLREEYENGRISGAEYTKAYIALVESALGNSVQFLLGRDAAYWQAAQAQLGFLRGRVELEIAKLQYFTARLQAATQRAAYAVQKQSLATGDVNFASAKFQLENILPIQEKLAELQVEVQNASVSDTKVYPKDPNVPENIAGVLAAQKELYQQQKESFKRDAENKAAKVVLDLYSVMLTVAEEIKDIDALDNEELNKLINKLKENNNLPITP